MGGLPERISLIIKEKEITKTAFAEKLNVSQAFVTQITKGTSQPSDRTIADICREFGVSETWLRTGEGEMYRMQSEDDELEKIFAEVGASNDALIKAILKAYWKLDEKEKAAIRKLTDDLLKHYKKESPGD